jgi:hypothetical protein
MPTSGPFTVPAGAVVLLVAFATGVAINELGWLFVGLSGLFLALAVMAVQVEAVRAYHLAYRLALAFAMVLFVGALGSLVAGVEAVPTWAAVITACIVIAAAVTAGLVRSLSRLALVAVGMCGVAVGASAMNAQQPAIGAAAITAGVASVGIGAASIAGRRWAFTLTNFAAGVALLGEGGAFMAGSQVVEGVAAVSVGLGCLSVGTASLVGKRRALGLSLVVTGLALVAYGEAMPPDLGEVAVISGITCVAGGLAGVGAGLAAMVPAGRVRASGPALWLQRWGGDANRWLRPPS